MEKAGLSAQERKVMDLLVAEERVVVRPDDILDIWSGSRANANATLGRLHKKGWMQRLKRGAYTVIPLGAGTDSPAVAAAWAIASDLFAPCFISGWSAAEHWALTDQIFNAISVVTTHPQRTRDQKLGGIRFRLRTLPQERAFGMRTVWFGSAKVNIADPHRTLIDILDAPDFGGGGRHAMDIVRAYWMGPHCNPKTLLSYAERFNRGTVFKRLGLTAERYGNPSREWLIECEKGLSEGISLLDPDSPDAGPILSRWRLRVNIPVDPM